MKARMLFAIAAILLAEVGSVGASENSKRLQARGLVDFHAGRLTEALNLFDQAVAEDPADIAARYYRGITRGQLGDYETAISDLQAVLETRPDFNDAALELGVVLVQAARYGDAIAPLEQAQKVAELEARASFFLGMARLRLAQFEEARANFERAGRDAEWSTAAKYYEAIVDYQEGKWSAAETRFASVAESSPTSMMGREAAKFLERLRAAGAARYGVYGVVGFEYDSNVVLAPADAVIKDATDISQQADGRAFFNVGGTFVPWRNEFARLSVGYDLYQSVHVELSEFNIQDHRPSIQFGMDAGPLRWGVEGRYDYYLLETSSFLQEATALPWITVPEGGVGRTELWYRMRRRDFKQQSFFVLDAFNHAAALRQVIYLGSPDRTFSVGYQFDLEDPVINGALLRSLGSTPQDAEAFGYDGNEVNAAVGWGLPEAVAVSAAGVYRNERYDGASKEPRVAGGRRRDEEYQVIASVTKQLNDYVALTAAYFGTFNNSNDPAFEYDRHIGSLLLEVRY